MTTKLKFIISSLTATVIAGILIWLYYANGKNEFSILETIVSLICTIILIYILLRPCYYLYCKIAKKHFSASGSALCSLFYNSNITWLNLFTAWGFFLCSLVCFIFTSPVFRHAINFDNLYYNPSGGIYSYYCLVESPSGKEYTLPCEILKGIDSYSYTRYNAATFNYDETEKKYNVYIIRRIYFNEGQYVFLEEPIEVTAPGKKGSGTDRDGNVWSVTLSNNKSHTSYINEYFHIGVKQIIIYVSTILSNIILLIVWIYPVIKTKEFLIREKARELDYKIKKGSLTVDEASAKIEEYTKKLK